MFPFNLFLRLSSWLRGYPVDGMRTWSSPAATSKTGGEDRFRAPKDFWRQRSFYTFPLCWLLLLLSLEITGEPNSHNHEESHKQQALSPGYLLHAARDSGGGDDGGGGDEVGGTTTFHATIQPTVGYRNSVQNGNQSDTKETAAAAVIASSFRNNPESPTTSSNEEVEATQQKSSTKTKTGRKCHKNELLRCIEKIPPMNDTGIPSTLPAVKRACRFYDDGMSCFDSWTSMCLPDNLRMQMKASITGAHEIYSFLCKDPKFQADFLKHGACFKKLSDYWDDCSNQFIRGLKQNRKQNLAAFCCIRLEFITCVSEHTAFLCGREATKFTLKMAETLVRSSVKTHTPEQCHNIRPKDCNAINTAQRTQHHLHSHRIIFLAIQLPFSCFLLITSQLLLLLLSTTAASPAAV